MKKRKKKRQFHVSGSLKIRNLVVKKSEQQTHKTYMTLAAASNEVMSH